MGGGILRIYRVLPLDSHYPSLLYNGTGEGIQIAILGSKEPVLVPSSQNQIRPDR